MSNSSTSSPKSESAAANESDPARPVNSANVAADDTRRRRSARRRPWLLLLLLATLIALLAVRPDLRGPARQAAADAARTVAYDGLGLSPRALFVWRLRIAGLYDSPLGTRWRTAVDRAQPVAAGSRLQRRASFTADAVEAQVYTTALGRGQQLQWRLRRDTANDVRLYAAVERRDDADDEWSSVTDVTADGAVEHVVASRAGEYRIVLQPELFGVVDYDLAMATGGSLVMPVQNAAIRDIGSGFGAPRDGGSRSHHGVDIFAKRGTPLIAVTDGRVRTGTSGIGGNHIWLSGGVFGIGSARYYYAHLDSFNVESGDSVNKGDVIGYVGNTGNARTTPPHLHFGIYAAGGPVDPAPFLRALPALPGG